MFLLGTRTDEGLSLHLRSEWMGFFPHPIRRACRYSGLHPSPADPTSSPCLRLLRHKPPWPKVNGFFQDIRIHQDIKASASFLLDSQLFASLCTVVRSAMLRMFGCWTWDLDGPASSCFVLAQTHHTQCRQLWGWTQVLSL